MMITSDNNTQRITDDFARFCADAKSATTPWLTGLRQEAFRRFENLGFPTTRQEEWRFTNVKRIAETEFALAEIPPPLSRETISPFVLDEDYLRLVFVNGHYVGDLSATAATPQGAVVSSLSAALADQPALIEDHLGQLASDDNAYFAALNSAFIRDGAFVHVPRGVVVERPIHLLFISTDNSSPTASHPRNLIIAQRETQATIIESYVGLNDGVYLTNAVTEVSVAENAVVDHCKLQQESAHGYHVATTQVRQQRASRFSSHYFSLGGQLVRNEVDVTLDDEGCECTLNGLYIAAGDQHMDNRTRIDHTKPHCNSHELYKGILDERAKGVFNGKIYVHPDAQKTDAKQSNRVLLLSDDAVIDTKPQLEIYADDVKCTHGATVGQIDETALYYLRSRGISEDLARSLLVFAFGNEIASELKLEAIRAHVERFLLAGQSLTEL
jgi:Fe-S cluster assembly protein SufD